MDKYFETKSTVKKLLCEGCPNSYGDRLQVCSCTLPHKQNYQNGGENKWTLTWTDNTKCQP